MLTTRTIHRIALPLLAVILLAGCGNAQQTPPLTSPAPATPEPSLPASPTPTATPSPAPPLRLHGQDSTLVVDATITPGNPQVGQTVRIDLQVTETSQVEIVPSYCFGDEDRCGEISAHRDGCNGSTPPPTSTSKSFSKEHVYKSPGTYTVAISVLSSGCGYSDRRVRLSQPLIVQ